MPVITPMIGIHENVVNILPKKMNEVGVGNVDVPPLGPMKIVKIASWKFIGIFPPVFGFFSWKNIPIRLNGSPVD